MICSQVELLHLFFSCERTERAAYSVHISICSFLLVQNYFLILQGTWPYFEGLGAASWWWWWGQNIALLKFYSVSLRAGLSSLHERGTQVICTAPDCCLPLCLLLCWSQTRMRIWTLLLNNQVTLGKFFAPLSLRIHTISKNNQTNLIALFEDNMIVST